MRKGLLVLFLVGMTVLASTGEAQAQRRGFGGWWGGGYYPQLGYYDSYYGGRGYGVLGYGYAPDYYYATPGYAVNPTYYYAQPAVITPPARAVQSFYSGPEEAQQVAAVTVVVPTADTQVWFGNTPTTQQGMERLFHSPALEPGKNFTYNVKARWTENGKAVERERQVRVQAGQKITVNFRDTPSETAPAPAPDAAPAIK